MAVIGELELRVKAHLDEAKRKIEDAEKAWSSFAKRGEQDARRITEWLKANEKAIVAIGATFGGITYKLAQWSPSMNLIFKEMGLWMRLLGMEIGERVAPHFKWLADLAEDLYKGFRKLPEPIQNFTGALTAVGIGFSAATAAWTVFSHVFLKPAKGLFDALGEAAGSLRSKIGYLTETVPGLTGFFEIISKIAGIGGAWLGTVLSLPAAGESDEIINKFNEMGEAYEQLVARVEKGLEVNIQIPPWPDFVGQWETVWRPWWEQHKTLRLDVSYDWAELLKKYETVNQQLLEQGRKTAAELQTIYGISTQMASATIQANSAELIEQARKTAAEIQAIYGVPYEVAKAAAQEEAGKTAAEIQAIYGVPYEVAKAAQPVIPAPTTTAPQTSPVPQTVWDYLRPIVESYAGTGRTLESIAATIWDQINSSLRGAFESGRWNKTFIDVIKDILYQSAPRKQAGGTVDYSGVYYLHAGEEVWAPSELNVLGIPTLEAFRSRYPLASILTYTERFSGIAAERQGLSGFYGRYMSWAPNMGVWVPSGSMAAIGGLPGEIAGIFPGLEATMHAEAAYAAEFPRAYTAAALGNVVTPTPLMPRQEAAKVEESLTTISFNFNPTISVSGMGDTVMITDQIEEVLRRVKEEIIRDLLLQIQWQMER